MKKKILVVAATASAAAAAYSHQADAAQYTVKPSDSLWSIAQKFNTSVEELKKLNKLSSNLIFPNQKLVVSGQAAQAASAATQVVKKKTPAAPAQNDVSGVHTVSSGESLISIARKYGTSYTKIMELNNMDSYLIHPGQKLKVTMTPGNTQNSTTEQRPPAPRTSQPEAVVEETLPAEAAEPVGSVTKHIVKHGEYLSMIADKYGVSVADIKEWNSMSSNIIFSNQVLIVSKEGVAKQVPATTPVTMTKVSTPAPVVKSPVFNHQNLYDYGQCTWHVFNKRAAAGKGISTYWWHAYNWANGARSDGYTVDTQPEVGAIAQTTNGPFGHVAYVERVNPDGTILVSEMNYHTPAGVVGYRTITKDQLSQYVFIH